MIYFYWKKNPTHFLFYESCLSAIHAHSCVQNEKRRKREEESNENARKTKYYKKSLHCEVTLVKWLFNIRLTHHCVDDCAKIIDLLHDYAVDLNKHDNDNIDNVLHHAITLSTTSTIKITSLETIIKSITQSCIMLSV